MTFAEQLDETTRKRGQFHSILSAIFGCISEVMVDQSAIVILFFLAIGGTSSLTMFTTAISALCGIGLLIPFTMIMNRIGQKESVRTACIVGCVGLFILLSAPFFAVSKQLSLGVAVLGLTIFCMQRSLYGVAWFPLLDNILRPEDRGTYFSKMRFSYLAFTTAFFFGIGLLMSNNPPIWLFQLIIAIAALTLLMRWYYIQKMPIDPNAKSELLPFKTSLSISVQNGPLVGWSIYTSLLLIPLTTIVPFTILYLKKEVQYSDDVVQIASTAGMLGCIVGYYIYRHIIKLLPTKAIEIINHFLLVAILFALFAIPKTTSYFIWIISALLFMSSINYSCYFCNASSEMMALARAGNKRFGMAFCQTYQNLGTAFGRIITSALVGSAMLSPHWTCGSVTVSNYQSVFLMLAIFSTLLLTMLPLLPALVPHHEDYYEPGASLVKLPHAPHHERKPKI